MPPRRLSHDRIDLLQGTLELLILRALRRGPGHGYGIGQAIRTGTGEVLQVETGSLYPALHRLEKRGLVRAEWKRSDRNQRARYYELTEAGHRQLAAERSRWEQVAAAISRMLDAADSEVSA